MKSRMEKYNLQENGVTLRNTANRDKYQAQEIADEIAENVVLNDNVAVIDSNINDANLSRLEYTKRKKYNDAIANVQEEVTVDFDEEEQIDYDIYNYLETALAKLGPKTSSLAPLEPLEIVDEACTVQDSIVVNEKFEITKDSQTIINTQVLNPSTLYTPQEENDQTYDLLADLKENVLKDKINKKDNLEENVLEQKDIKALDENIKVEQSFINEEFLKKAQPTNNLEQSFMVETEANPILKKLMEETTKQSNHTKSNIFNKEITMDDKESSFYDGEKMFSKKDFGNKQENNNILIYIVSAIIGLVIVGVIIFILMTSFK